MEQRIGHTREVASKRVNYMHMHIITHAQMHHVVSKLENAVGLRASICIVPPIIVYMLIAAKRAIFHACSAAICVATTQIPSY